MSGEIPIAQAYVVNDDKTIPQPPNPPSVEAKSPRYRSNSAIEEDISKGRVFLSGHGWPPGLIECMISNYKKVPYR